MKTAVIYARFSCSKQREASIEDQLRVCRDWCEREGYRVVAEYCDHAISGRTDERPSFQEMIANAGESDIVLVYMMDRFSRDPFDAPLYKHELGKRGVRLVSALEAIPDSPEGIIYEKLLEGLAACESRKTSIRTKRGLNGNALKCMANGVRVFGYRVGEDGRYEVEPTEAAMVREAFERHAQGESCCSIAGDFARRGVKTYTGRPCSNQMVYGMVKNEKYRGIYIFGDVRVEGGMPRIVEDAAFFAAQGVKGRKTRATEDWGRYILTQRAICAGCGRDLQGVSGRGRGGVKYEYYKCPNCSAKPVRRDWLEGKIAEALRAALSDREEALRIATAAAESFAGEDVQERKEQAAKSLRDAERGLRNILAAIEQGVVPPGTKERIEELERQRDRAKADMDALEERMAAIDPEDFADFLQTGATLTDEDLVDLFVFQVLVGDEDVLVTLNYDTKKLEPARFEISRVRANLVWLPG